MAKEACDGADPHTFCIENAVGFVLHVVLEFLCDAPCKPIGEVDVDECIVRFKGAGTFRIKGRSCNEGGTKVTGGSAWLLQLVLVRYVNPSLPSPRPMLTVVASASAKWIKHALNPAAASRSRSPTTSPNGGYKLGSQKCVARKTALISRA